MEINRRGFIGVLTAIPFVSTFSGEGQAMEPKAPDPERRDVDLSRDNGAREPLSMRRFGLEVFRLASLKLAGHPMRLVGPEVSYVGTIWGEGLGGQKFFTHQPYVGIRDLPMVGREIARDRLLMDDIAEQIADHVKRLNLTRFGLMQPIEHGCEYARYANSRWSLRFVTQWDLSSDETLGRFDLIGGQS